jgi:hypothetical protein
VQKYKKIYKCRSVSKGTSAIFECGILLSAYIAWDLVFKEKFWCFNLVTCHVLPQKVLINIGIESFADANENGRTFLAVTAHNLAPSASNEPWRTER